MRHLLTPIALAATLALLGPRAAAQTTTPAELGGLDRIVITAERRLATLDDTPAAVTALAGTDLAARGDTGLADLVSLSPNTTFTTGQGACQLFIRGIGNVFILAGGDPGVALHHDGLYISDQTSCNLGLFDVQRVEVLRGPQGALYGRNATGGAVNVVSARPVSQTQARGTALLGDRGRRELEGFVTGALGDSGWSSRVSLRLREYDGYTDNPLAGQVSGPVTASGSTTVAPRRQDDLRSRGLRLQLARAVGEGEWRILASHQREHDAGPSMPLLVDPVMIPGLLFGVQPSTDPRVMKSQGASNTVEVNTLQTSVDWSLGENTLSVSMGTRKSRTSRAWDSDATESLTTSSSFGTSSTDRSIDFHLSSAEGSTWQWIVGVTALDFDQSQDVVVAAQVPLGFLVPGAPFTVPVPGGVEFRLGGDVHTRSVAAYGDLRWRMTPTVSLLAGLRSNHDRKSAQEYLNVAAFGLAGTATPSDSWTSTPGSLGLEYKPSSALLLYGRLARGFKSGAVNLGALQPYLVRPETSSSLELGLKAEFAERRATLAASAFSTRYKDMQVSQVGQATTLLTNAAAARIDGLEVELAARPVRDLSLSLGLGLMDPRYTGFSNTDLRNNPNVAQDVSGRQLAFVPKSQAMLGVTHTSAVAGGTLELRANYGWHSRVYFTEFNTADAVQQAYGQLNLAAAWKPQGAKWQLRGWVRNVTDTTAVTSMSIASPVLGAARQVTYTPPRQFGLGLAVEL